MKIFSTLLLLFQLLALQLLTCSAQNQTQPSISYFIIAPKESSSLKKLVDLLKQEIAMQDEIIIAQNFNDKFLCKCDYIFTLHQNEKPSIKLLKKIREIVGTEADGYYIPIINSPSDKTDLSKGTNEEQLRIVKNSVTVKDSVVIRKKINVNVKDNSFIIYRENEDDDTSENVVQSCLYYALVHYLKNKEKDPFSIFLKKEGALKIFGHVNIQYVVNKELNKKVENKYIQNHLEKFLATNPSQEEINKFADGIVRLIFS